MSAGLCSICRIRPNRSHGRVCLTCHAAQSRDRRATDKTVLLDLVQSVRELTQQLKAERRPAKRVEPADNREEKRA
jgi:hypothetical protein